MIIMVDCDNLIVNIVKKTTSVIFSDFSSREMIFAKKYAETKNSEDSYNFAFSDVNKVRASSLLQNTEIWEVVIDHLRKKNKKTIEESLIIKHYDEYKESFVISPLEAYRLFVDENDGQTISSKLQIDCCNSLRFLIFAYPFFKTLNRDYFIKNITKAINNDIDQINVQCRGSEKDYILRKAKQSGISLNEIFEE